MLEPLLSLIDPKAPRAKRRRGLVLLYGIAAILQLPIPSLVAPLDTGMQPAGLGVVVVFMGLWLTALVVIEWLSRRTLKTKKPSALAQIALLDGGLFGMALVLGILLIKYGAVGWAWALVVLGLLWLLRGFFRLAPLV